MRIFPLLLALLVGAILFIVVFEREALIGFATGGNTAETAEATAQEAPGAAADNSQAEQVATAASGNATPAEAEDERSVSVVAVNSASQVIDSAVLIRGQTEAARQVVVRSETVGTVISEPLSKGTQVEAGAPLCQIDSGTREISLADAKARVAEAEARVPEAQARVEEARSRVPEAEARLAEAQSRLAEAQINDRAAQQLIKDGFASEARVASPQATVEAAKAGVQTAKSGVEASLAGVQSALSGVKAARAGVQSAQAAVASAETEIDRLTITAPFAGVLESVAAEVGSFMQPGSECATILQLDPIKLVGFAPETEVDKIRVGTLAGARLSSGREVTGKVTFLSRSADPLTRTFRVEVVVPNPDLAIRDGQTAEINIASDGAIAHLLPSSSMTLNDDGILGVRIVDEDSRAQFMPVTILRDTVNGVWLAGLPPMAKVITVGQEYVIDGVKVDASLQELGQ